VVGPHEMVVDHCSPCTVSVDRVEGGWWRSPFATTSVDVHLDGGIVDARVFSVCRALAQAQRAFAHRRYATVRKALDQANMLLPRQLQVVVVRGEFVMPPERLPSSPEYLLSRCARIVWREFRELQLLVRFARGSFTLHRLLVVAYREECVWILCDPRWPGSDADDEDDCADPRARATAIRRLDRPRAGQVGSDALRRAGGERALLRGAMTDLATGPLRPWSDGSETAEMVPVRVAAIEARERAVRWLGYQ
jgi:hypothetical protein